MFASSWLVRGKAAVEGSDTQKKLAELLLDENAKVLSTFELNQVASLTYNDTTCDEIFEMLDEVIGNPVDFSPLSLQKALVVTKHVLIYGSEKVVQSAWAMSSRVIALREFNTVLIAQQKGTAGAFWQNIKGGSVDKGEPVREAAEILYKILQSKEQIQIIRHTHADPNSLVPVGSDKVAFVSDDVRLFMLQKRMEEQLNMRTKSNLAKASGGFGGGYQSKDGKMVVGAAHSVEEMLAAAKREKKRYTDEAPPKNSHVSPADAFAVELASEASLEKITMRDIPGAAPDLLGFGSTNITSTQKEHEVDLLDMSSTAPVQTNSTDLLGTGADLIGTNTVTHDPFGAHVQPPGEEIEKARQAALMFGGITAEKYRNDSQGASTKTSSAVTSDLMGATSSLSGPDVSATSDLLSMMTVAPSGTEQAVSEVSQNKTLNGVSNNELMGINMTQPPPEPVTSGDAPGMSSIMGSGVDRFSALDDLASKMGAANGVQVGSATNVADEAMNRILNGGDTSKTSGTSPTMLENSSQPELATTGNSMPPLPAAPPPLTPPDLNNHSITGSLNINDTSQQQQQFALPPTAAPPVMLPDSELKMGGTFGDPSAGVGDNDDDLDSSFLMGGGTGMGLQPMGEAPAAPPPPPPPI